MPHDMEQLLILMQRRLNCIREINNLTRELDEPLHRNDQVSALLILRQRADEMARYDACQEEIIRLEKKNEELKAVVGRLSARPPLPPPDTAGEEEKRAYEISLAIFRLVEETKQIDKRLNRRIAGEKTFYR